LIFFFFSSRRRHTIFSRDWSSDVCSSDLSLTAAGAGHGPQALLELRRAQRKVLGHVVDDLRPGVGGHAPPLLALERGLHRVAHRSEERRVGKEGSARSAPNHEQKTS